MAALQEAVTLGLAGISVIGAGWSILKITWFTSRSFADLKNEVATLSKTVDGHGDVSARLGKLETQILEANLVQMGKDIVRQDERLKIFFAAISPALKDIIKQPHPSAKRKDELMDRFPNLTDEEVCELKAILQYEVEEFRKHDTLESRASGEWATLKLKSLAYALQQAAIELSLFDRRAKCK